MKSVAQEKSHKYTYLVLLLFLLFSGVYRYHQQANPLHKDFDAMKTSQYFLDDEPIQILFLDTDHTDARIFFDRGLGSTWFDYELHLIHSKTEAQRFIVPVKPRQRPLDLLLISNRAWTTEGEQLVTQIRTQKKLTNLPVYCIASCPKKNQYPPLQCWDPQWRLDTDCDKDARIASIPYKPNLTSASKAQINGIICPNSLEHEMTKIINNMTTYWFHTG